MLRQYTHWDVHPDPVGADELRDRTYHMPAPSSRDDPSAKTVGPALRGWSAYPQAALEQSSDSGIGRIVT